MRSKLFNTIITTIIILLLKKNQKLSPQTATEKFSMKVSKPPQVPLMFKRKQKMTMSPKLLISIKKLQMRPIPKTPSRKPEDKFQSKESSLMVVKPESLHLTKQIQLQLLQPRLHQAKQKRKKLHLEIQKIPINKRLSLWKKFSMPSRNKELSRTPATKMFLLLKINITINLRTPRTPLELTERSKLTEDSFTIHQLMKSIIKLRKRSHLLPKKKKRKLKEVKLSHSLHPNLTNKRKNPSRKSSLLSASKEFGKTPATKMLPLLN